MSFSQKIQQEFLYLNNKKNRKEAYQYLVEGIRGCEELIKTRLKPLKVVYSESIYKYESGVEVLKQFDAWDVEMHKAPLHIFRKLCCTQSPQGIVCIVPMKLNPIKPELEKEKAQFVIIDKISDPGNLGTIIRSAAAFNINGMFILAESVELYNPKTIRAAMGANLLLPMVYDVPPEVVISELEKYNIDIILTDPHTGIPYKEMTYPAKFAVVIGNEHHGVSGAFDRPEYKRISIPTSDRVESLNAAISSSIIFSEVACL